MNELTITGPDVIRKEIRQLKSEIASLIQEKAELENYICIQFNIQFNIQIVPVRGKYMFAFESQINGHF